MTEQRHTVGKSRSLSNSNLKNPVPFHFVWCYRFWWLIIHFVFLKFMKFLWSLKKCYLSNKLIQCCVNWCDKLIPIQKRIADVTVSMSVKIRLAEKLVFLVNVCHSRKITLLLICWKISFSQWFIPVWHLKLKNLRLKGHCSKVPCVSCSFILGVILRKFWKTF